MKCLANIAEKTNGTLVAERARDEPSDESERQPERQRRASARTQPFFLSKGIQ
jgi:hypothetical protein